jgi:S-adenosylmethionine/arginine decarboxylase-like enzyme
MGPYVKYCEMKGNRGITAVAIIETSHIAMHIWDEVSPALMQFDVYSCGDLNVEDICRKIENDFEIRKMEFKFLNREAGLQEISKK